MRREVFLPAELLRSKDTRSKNSGGERRHRGPGPYKACNTKPPECLTAESPRQYRPLLLQHILPLSSSLSWRYRFTPPPPYYLQAFSFCASVECRAASRAFCSAADRQRQMTRLLVLQGTKPSHKLLTCPSCVSNKQFN